MQGLHLRAGAGQGCRPGALTRPPGVPSRQRFHSRPVLRARPGETFRTPRARRPGRRDGRYGEPAAQAHDSSSFRRPAAEARPPGAAEGGTRRVAGWFRPPTMQAARCRTVHRPDMLPRHDASRFVGILPTSRGFSRLDRRRVRGHGGRSRIRNLASLRGGFTGRRRTSSDLRVPIPASDLGAN